jgi:hypothetical protein
LTSQIPSFSGTTNYHAKFTSGTTIGNSLIWDNGTNVGIGNTNTSYTLDVSGTGRFTDKITSTFGSNGTMIENTSSTTNYLNIIRTTSTGSNFTMWIENSTGGNRAVGSLAYAGGLCTYTSTALQLGTDNNIRMTITSAGRVGIGTTNPADKFCVSNAGVEGLEFGFNTGSSYIISYNRSTSAYIPLILQQGGGGVTIPTGPLFVGITSGDASYVFQLPNNSSNKAKAYAWDTYSDERIKKDIVSISYGLNEILKLNPVSYKQYDSETIENEIILKDTYKENIGFIAQQAFDIIPEAVNKGQEEHELWGMDYSKLVPVLVKAIQESHQIIKDLEARIVTLEQK